MVSCSVLSDSVQLFGLSPTRFLCPVDFTGMNTEWVDIFPFQVIFPNSGVEPASPEKGFFTCWNNEKRSYSFLQWKNAEKISKGKRLPSNVQSKSRVGFLAPLPVE